MPKPRPTLIDEDNPKLDEAFFANAKFAAEILPPELVAISPKRTRGQRGPQKKPVKVAVKLRLDPDIVEALKAGGEGWQTRANNALRKAFLNK